MATAIDAFTLPEELSRLGRNFYAIAYLDEQEQQSLSLENPIAWLADLEIGLGIWEGVFEDVPGYWLRWCDDAGNWFLTDTEQAEAQLLQAARNLLATGMEIAQVAKILGLSEAQVQALESSH